MRLTCCVVPCFGVNFVFVLILTKARLAFAALQFCIYIWNSPRMDKRACVRVCVRACVRVCVRACVRACLLHVCMCVVNLPSYRYLIGLCLALIANVIVGLLSPVHVAGFWVGFLMLGVSYGFSLPAYPTIISLHADPNEQSQLQSTFTVATMIALIIASELHTNIYDENAVGVVAGAPFYTSAALFLASGVLHVVVRSVDALAGTGCCVLFLPVLVRMNGLAIFCVVSPGVADYVRTPCMHVQAWRSCQTASSKGRRGRRRMATYRPVTRASTHSTVSDDGGDDDDDDDDDEAAKGDGQRADSSEVVDGLQEVELTVDSGNSSGDEDNELPVD